MKFDLEEYQRTESANTKIKVFTEFLYTKYGVSPDTEKFDNEYFQLFNDDDLIESLNYYIEKNGITAQVTASNYIGYIKDFFYMLSEKHGIVNETFTNVKLQENLLLKSKEIINTLKETESKNIATDEQYEQVNYCITNFLNELNISDIYEEIDYFREGTAKRRRLYHRYVSVIAVKLIMQFALGSRETALLDVNDFDMNNNLLHFNKFKLKLNNELVRLINNYLEIRNYILQLYSIRETRFFVKIDGTAYIKGRRPPEYTTFFMILADAIGSRASELFADRRVLEMLNKGIDVDTVSRLSGKSVHKCIELQRINNSGEDMEKKLRIFFDNSLSVEKKIVKKKKNYINCPICNRDVHAVSDELVLVQYENNPIKYIACKSCRGQHETR